MAEVQRPGLRTWGEEIGLLWRRSWWLIPAFFVASWFTFIPGVQNFLSFLPLALVGLIVIWVVLVFRRMPHTDEAKWRREVGRTLVSTGQRSRRV